MAFGNIFLAGDPRGTHLRRPGKAFRTTRYFRGNIFLGEGLPRGLHQELSPENIFFRKYPVVPIAASGSMRMRLITEILLGRESSVNRDEKRKAGGICRKNVLQAAS